MLSIWKEKRNEKNGLRRESRGSSHQKRESKAEEERGDRSQHRIRSDGYVLLDLLRIMGIRQYPDTQMMCEYCDKNVATVEVPINEEESIHLCWFCAERKEEVIDELLGL